MIPMDRIIGKLDRLYEADDTAGAERLLLYWYEEAKAENDERGMLSLSGELMGLYRKCGRGKEALACVADSMWLVDRLGIGDSVSAATVYLNCGTVKTAFGKAAEALPLFAKAAAIYERMLPPTDARLGGLYNNTATALADAGQYGEAAEAYEKALHVMEQVPGSEPELAVTKLNLADLAEAASRDGDIAARADAAETIDGLLAEARALLEKPGVPRNGHYAFVAGKCAPVFERHGWFLYAGELRRRSADIYAGGRSGQ